MPSLSTGSRKPRSVADGPAPWIFPTFLFFLSISFAGQAGATDPFQKLPQIQEWNSGSSSGTVAPLSETSPGSTSTCIYFENFEDSTHGWTAFDRFGGTVYWTRTTFSGRSVWWCGVDDPCFAAGSGYGPFWYQKLSKSFALPSAPITLSLVHQYDVETNYDFAYVDVSTDGGVTFTN